MRTGIRKIEALLLSLLLLGVSARAEWDEPDVSAQTAILLEAESGICLYGKAAEQPMKAASTIKLLTALAALEVLNPADVVTVPLRCCNQEGSSMYLQPGESYTVRELLTGLLLASGNDAAAALAYAADGTEACFVTRMNRIAASLGMEHSVFVDASGLKAEGHTTTAGDMAKLACAALREPLIRELMGTRNATIHGQTYVNHNKLLWRCEGTFGGKTGYTTAAGRTLISCTEREGMTLVCVTMNAPDDWNDHEKLLHWAYSKYRLFDASERSWTVPLVSGLQDTVTLRAGELKCPVKKDREPELSLSIPRFLYAPVYKDTPVGSLRLLGTDGVILGETALFSTEDAALDESQPLSFWEQLRWYWYYTCKHTASYPVYGYY